MKFTNFKPPTQDALDVSPSQDWTPRFSVDQEIRREGYTIKSRPDDEEAIWERNGYEFTQSEVLARMRRGKKKAKSVSGRVDLPDSELSFLNSR